MSAAALAYSTVTPVVLSPAAQHHAEVARLVAASRRRTLRLQAHGQAQAQAIAEYFAAVDEMHEAS